MPLNEPDDQKLVFPAGEALDVPDPCCQLALAVWSGHAPYPMRPPSAIPMPFAEYQRPITVGCCFRVNHIPVMATIGQRKSAFEKAGNIPKAGSATASNMPAPSVRPNQIAAGILTGDKAECQERLVRLGPSLSHEKHAPKEDVDREVLGQGKLAAWSASPLGSCCVATYESKRLPGMAQHSHPT
jgi:hypothetical protein